MKNFTELEDLVQNRRQFKTMKRKSSPRRKSINVPLFIVEGFTEENYLKTLQKIYDKSASIENCKGGGAKSVLLKAEELVMSEAEYYNSFIIIYDLDTYSTIDEPLKNQIHSTDNVNILEFDPCFENWLLLHFQNKKIKTLNCDKCIATLKKYIPNYEKNNFRLLEKFVNKDKFNLVCEKHPIIGKILKEYFF